MRISYCDGQLTCEIEGSDPVYRSFDNAACEQAKAWARRYGALVGIARSDGLLGLGKEIYLWLDGDQEWLGSLGQGVGHRALEFATDPELDETASAFLDVPWEILATEAGFGRRLPVERCSFASRTP